MSMFAAGAIADMTGGRLAAGCPTTQVTRVWTDSRTTRRGDLFVALTGERFDGHRFVGDAIRKGAVGALVRRGYGGERMTGTALLPRKAVLIEVDDPLRAYQDLAGAYRRRFPIPVVAVSGSNGKTTTKEMIGRIVSERFDTLMTEGNLNNHIGVPQTLFRMKARHEAAVIEMGVSGLGEMTRLCDIAAPTHGVLTNIGPTHLATLGNIQTVARAKGELLEALPPDGTAVLNADDAFFKELCERARGRIVSFGYAEHADVRALRVESSGPAFSKVRMAVHGRARPFSVALGATGRHNVANALAAAAAGIALGLGVETIRAGLSRYRPSAMRSEVRRWRGATVLNDCYNANPVSVRAALQWMADLKGSGRTFAVLGDMLELGGEAEQAHREIGRELARSATDYALTMGDLGARIAAGALEGGLPTERVVTAKDPETLAEYLQRVVRKGDVVLVKGSRGARMERVLEAIGL
jgi:UDP-N-acetylmuramoyl-tripeptide--D-alanyl-D-alanine ligase